jgi:hypothetical protein
MNTENTDVIASYLSSKHVKNIFVDTVAGLARNVPDGQNNEHDVMLARNSETFVVKTSQAISGDDDAQHPVTKMDRVEDRTPAASDSQNELVVITASSLPPPSTTAALLARINDLTDRIRTLDSQLAASTRQMTQFNRLSELSEQTKIKISSQLTGAMDALALCEAKPTPDAIVLNSLPPHPTEDHLAIAFSRLMNSASKTISPTDNRPAGTTVRAYAGDDTMIYAPPPRFDFMLSFVLEQVRCNICNYI